MRTKFSAIVDLRKKNMQKCEREIMQNENRIANKHNQIAHLNQSFENLKIPQNGSFDCFRAFEISKKAILYEIEMATQELQDLQNTKNALQERYRHLNIEYEKIKLLDKKVQDEAIKELKYREKIESDEIATMLYNNTLGGVV